jgi:hypothetical protein
MEKVLGLGGFFFRAKDPKNLARWYAEALGVDETPPDYEHAYWVQERGPTVFEPFAERTDYFGESKYQYPILRKRVASELSARGCGSVGAQEFQVSRSQAYLGIVASAGGNVHR